jgi:lantibiotic modifying enzyme
VAGVFPVPPAERVRQDLAGLTQGTVAFEARALRAALARPAKPSAPRVERPSEREVLGALVERIAGLSLPSPAGPVWVRLWEQPPAFVAPAGPGLCYGASGIAVALAEAARALDEEAPARLALQALEPWRRLALEGRGGELAARIRPGWGAGLGGMLAAFAWCAGLLEDPGLLDEVERLAEAAGAAMAHPGPPDLLDGAAGLALGGCVLAGARPSPAATAMLRACGEVMLARSKVEDGRRSWPDRSRPGLPGLSHGASGIAAALAGVGEITGEAAWLAAAAEALAYEDGLFDPVEANWAAAGAPRPFASKWCHGAPGIALARQRVAALSPELADAQAPAIATALATAAARSLEDCDDLCCGEAGRIEVLTVMGRRTGEDAALAAAETALGGRLDDWRRGEVRTLSRMAGAPDDASLLRGLAGPAHVLARRLNPAGAVDVLMPLRG